MQIKPRVCLRALGLGLMLAVAASVLAATAPTAGASIVPPGGITTLAVSSVFPPGTREVFHTCKVIGHAGTVQAVHCADLLTNEGPDPDNGLEIWVQNEVYCQRIAPPNQGSTTACSGIHERVGYGIPGHTFAVPQQICGGLFHHSVCTGGRDEHSFLATLVTPVSSRTCSIWAESVHDSVVLPTSGHPTVSAALVATPHYTYHIGSGESCIEVPL